MAEDRGQSHLQTLARDMLALGSWIFYLLILGRAMIAPYRPFTDQMILAGLLIVVTGLIGQRWDQHVARAMVIAICVIVFYESPLFSIFVIVAVAGLVLSGIYLGRGIRRVAAGLLVGAVCAVLGIFISQQTHEWILPDVGRGPAHLDEE